MMGELKDTIPTVVSVLVITLCLSWVCVDPPIAFAQELDTLEWDDEYEGTGGYNNIFLGTDTLWLKAIVFVIGCGMLFVFWRIIFGAAVKINQSPAMLFTVCFSMFLLSIYGLGFLCFSEYVLEQRYDPQVWYLWQLNIWILLGSFVSWVIISVGLTHFFKGNA